MGVNACSSSQPGIPDSKPGSHTDGDAACAEALASKIQKEEKSRAAQEDADHKLASELSQEQDQVAKKEAAAAEKKVAREDKKRRNDRENALRELREAERKAAKEAKARGGDGRYEWDKTKRWIEGPLTQEKWLRDPRYEKERIDFIKSLKPGDQVIAYNWNTHRGKIFTLVEPNKLKSCWKITEDGISFPTTLWWDATDMLIRKMWQRKTDDGGGGGGHFETKWKKRYVPP